MPNNVPLEIRRLETGDPRPEFCCGDDDLDEFFHKDSADHYTQLLCVTYTLYQGEDMVAFYSLLNDAIRKEDVRKRSELRELLRFVPRAKHYSSMPAAKIGRLGVAKQYQRNGLGREILDILKVSFTTQNKTGCRFLIVDAYNKPQVMGFYQKNGFLFLTDEDTGEHTRTMYFDLMPFSRAAAG